MNQKHLKTLTTENPLYNELKALKNMFYKTWGWKLTNLKWHSEGVDYGACSFELNGHSVAYRVSKITPTKTGQFVAIWKRNTNAKTEPFDVLDHIDFLVITSKSGDNIGLFIFPKSVLVDKGVFSQKGKGGKRGIRMYPPWDITTNKQAKKTQQWQVKYFVTLRNNTPKEPELLKELFTKPGKKTV